MKIARVAIDVPVPKLFDYHAEGLGPGDIGQRVLVPLGNRNVVGLVVALDIDSAVAPERLKPVRRVLREVPALSPCDLDLLRFAAAYYHHPLGAAVMAALPGALRRARLPRDRLALDYLVTPKGESANLDTLPRRATVQRRLLAALKHHRELSWDALRSAAGPKAGVAVKQLIMRGWVRSEQRADAPAQAPRSPTVAGGPALTPEQIQATGAIAASFGRFGAFVLLGVTGSGKTEVYLHAIAAVLRAGGQALLLVPEIVLTPQLEALIHSRFPDTVVATLHSRLSEAERLQHWRAAQDARAGVVLGTRLAVFAPIPRLALIIVDEEHDLSFKQMDALRYSARDLAVVRAKQMHVPVVLGSATPALETYHNAVSGRYQLLHLTKRVGAVMPQIECINTHGERLVDGLSQPLLQAIAARLGGHEQSLVFINRRGYAPVLMCRACGWLSACHRCTAQLVLHVADHRLHCHHCGSQARVPVACPDCGNQDLAPLGQGTQRVEVALARQFPAARIMRIDRDSTRRKDMWPTVRQQIQAREIDILVGTQILAKGHDFPHLSLVGVLNADSLLYSTDFRAPERLYALLTQVAGRAGRGDKRGEVMIQTEFPRHPLYEALRRQDYASFAAAALTERRQAGFPPFVHQALLRAEAAGLETSLAFLDDAARAGKALSQHVVIYDPVPAGMVRRAGRERAQLLVQAASRSRLREFLGKWYERLSAAPSTRARWSLDVDPVEF